ncbi:non-specific lipid transfer protein GPI-anchored 15 [Corylus avellana]|uniref:non-specific lipid transfer protein GPI-anchored 15 n=1 Tax=Corylus avellana TaxID=13451 RepID=UPI001E217171|nr:non-specific lipid transfer protein GPI-anchored 15 [Corylus avellana]
MAFKGIEMGFVVVLVAMLSAGAGAQSGCTSVLSNLSPCLNYITGNSSTPSSSCCSQLSNVIQTSPRCLCSALNGGAASLGITINQTLALSLPTACNMQTPPINQCKAANGPPSSGSPPVGSPAGAITPSASDTPSGTGSKTVPSLDGGFSDGSVVKAPLHLMLFLLFIMSCAETLLF